MAIDKIGGICTTKRKEKEKPYLKELYYIRKIVCNRFKDDAQKGYAFMLLEKAFKLRATLESLGQFAADSESWDDWERGMNDYIQEHKLEED